jgi:cyclopropane fatty-acyl-phospholipid synthase-like methyltransferase
MLSSPVETPPTPLSLDESYDAYERIEDEFQAALDESLNPRGQELLYDIVRDLHLPPGASVLDLGCGDGRHSLKLAQEFGFAVTGVDPVRHHVDVANERLTEATAQDPELAGRVHFEVGWAESLTLSDASVDLIWSTDVLGLVQHLDQAFAECRRVLRNDGRMLAYYTSFRLDRLEASELTWLSERLGIIPANSDAAHFESAFVSAGFSAEQALETGSEWGEFSQERTGEPGRRLLHAARLMREPERYIARFGQTGYDIMLSDCLWHVYRMIGKLSSRVYLLKPTESRA